MSASRPDRSVASIPTFAAVLILLMQDTAAQAPLGEALPKARGNSNAVWTSGGAGVLSMEHAWMGLHASVTPSGLTVIAEGALCGTTEPVALSITTTSFGRRGAATDFGAGALRSNGVRAEIVRPGVIEWFEHHEQGLEQGWTIPSAPERKPNDDAPLWIGLRFEGLYPQIYEDGSGAKLVDERAQERMRYSGLVVRDATGRRLEARLATRAGCLGIQVEDVGARYPLVVDPILSGVAWTFFSGQADAELSVASTAGDVNGDGYSDLVVASSVFDTVFGCGGGSQGCSEGRVWIFHGGPSGLSTLPARVLNGPVQDSPGFGAFVACLGDLDANGYDELAIGSPDYDNGQTDEGGVWVYFGGLGGIPAAENWKLEGNQADLHLGLVRYAGDINGDLKDDLLVATQGGGLTDTVSLYLSSTPSSPGTLIWTIALSQLASSGVTSSHDLRSIAGAGDVDADGYDDILLGITGGNSGRVLLFRGGMSGPSTIPTWVGSTGSGGQHISFGQVVRPLGDLQGDGYADFAVTDDDDMRVFLGAVSGVPTVLASVLSIPPQSDGAFGLCAAGDVEGDGRSDFLIRVPGGGQAGLSLHRGSQSGFDPTPFNIPNPPASDNHDFGTELGTAGDVNGDGRSDIYATSPRGSAGSVTAEGAVFVYHGQPSDPPVIVPPATSLSGTSNARFATSVAMNGDVNGDGFTDTLVGAPQKVVSGIACGEVRVYLGGAGGTSSTPSWSFPATATPSLAGDLIGAAVAFAGDVNNDGFGDILVGAPGTDLGQNDEGRTFLFFGNAAGMPSESAGRLWDFQSNEVDALLGSSVAGGGDVNGDGFADVLIGAPGNHLGNTNRGAVYVFMGAAFDEALVTSPPPVLTLAATLDQGADSTRFGAAVAFAGDINRDGLSDVLVGAPDAQSSMADQLEGWAYLYMGVPGGVSTTPASIGQGNSAFARYGSSLAGVGDLDTDGYSDVVIGAPFFELLGNPGAGKVFAYAGSAGSAPDLFATAAWSYTSTQADAELGSSVAGAADFNSDGFCDIVVGARLFNVSDSGRVFVFLGNDQVLPANPAQTIDGSAAGDHFGAAVAAGGDLDADGFGDLGVGAPDANSGGGGLLIYIGSQGGAPVRCQQRKINVVRAMDRLALVDSTTTLNLRTNVTNSAGTVTSTVAGRERVAMQWELAELANLLDGAGWVRTAFADSGPLATALAIQTPDATLQPNRSYHWRSRIVTDNPLFPTTRWQSLAGNGFQEKECGTGVDCNGNNLEDTQETQNNPAIDCNGNDVPDSCDIATGVDPDCDGDTIPNSCDLAANDCDGDGCPDNCELAGNGCSGSGSGVDCNNNLRLDNCDIALGSSLDANGNGVPDDCEFIPYCFGDGTGLACPCGNNGGAGRGCANSANPNGARLLASGIPQISSDTVVLTSSNMTGATCVFFQGASTIPPIVVDDGIGCVGGPVVRLGTKPVIAGTSSYPQGADLTISVRGLLPVVGGTRHYQCFYRNASATFCPPATSNRSNGVTVVWVP